MPKTLYDEQGNAIENVWLPDEVKPLQEKTSTVEQELNDTKEKLAKLSNKDFNFRRLEEMTEAERAKLSATEIELKKRQEALEEQQSSFTKQVIESHKTDALAVLAGDDEELRKKITLNFERIKDDATTKEEIFKKMKDAYKLTNEATNFNPIASAMGHIGVPPRKENNKPVSDDLKDLAAKMGIKADELK